MLFNFNWIDILAVLIIIRVTYTGWKSRFLIEVFSLFGILMATFFTLHFFTRFGQFLDAMLSLPEDLLEPGSYVLLCLTIVVIFKLIASGWLVMIKFKSPPALDQWGGSVLAFIRGLFICSLIYMFFLVSGQNYWIKTTQQALTYKTVVDVAPNFYEGFYDTLVGKYFTDEHINMKVFTVKGTKPPEKKKQQKTGPVRKQRNIFDRGQVLDEIK